MYAPSRAEASTDGSVAPGRRVLQIVTATSLVAVLPIVAVWWLRSSGLLTSYLPGMAIGVVLSFGAAHLGRIFWQTRPGSQHLLFSELLLWGYVHRSYTERRLASARSVLGTMSQAQSRLEDGLTPERQTRLLEQLARAMDARDPKTHGHSKRVARYAWMIAMRMNLPREEVARIRTAAAVHDVGKFGTPLSILRKNGPLDDEQYEVMKRHPGDGARLVSVLNDDGLTAMVRHHHERLDGTGYPDRLAGEAIPLGARIISVADTFDAITAHRPYRAARSHKEGLSVLEKEAGKQLDPEVVRAFCGHYSGKRPLTFWTSLMTLPERALEQLGSGVGAVAAATKVAAVAAVIGALAAGGATLTQASARSSLPTFGAGDPIGSRSSAAQSAAPAGSLPVLDPVRPGGGRAGGLAEEAPAGLSAGGSTVGAGAPVQSAGSGAPAAGSPAQGPPAEAAQTHEPSKSTGAGGGSGGGHAQESGGAPHEGRGGAESTAPEGTVKEVVGGAVREVGGTVKEVGSTVGGTVKEVGGTVGGTVKEVGGVVRETGKSVGEITAPVTTGAGKTVEEVTSKVLSEAPGKVTEVKGKVGEVVGKLKL